ncbi:hypothetical protein [Paenibacillus terrigena]|uniref:hypothetical protein n=1 Tax=Paenibacillus terrigena TaxID=369333 RepID=UPI000378D7E2|nr:hypothetical protein [Paenibacillus terrigena]
MSSKLYKFISRLTDEELEKCFLEIYHNKVNGDWPSDSIVKSIWKRFKDENGLDIFPIHTMIEAFLFEIAVRKYREDDIEV